MDTIEPLETAMQPLSPDEQRLVRRGAKIGAFFAYLKRTGAVEAAAYHVVSQYHDTHFPNASQRRVFKQGAP